MAIAHDVPIPGWQTPTCLNLRLWESAAYSDFDLTVFNQGNYYKAVEKKQQAETISSVLYPNDGTPEGKELRLKQQYFFAAATLRDIVRRYKKNHTSLEKLHESVAIQLNGKKILTKSNKIQTRTPLFLLQN
jgi:starch phosphorylase